VIRQVMRSPSRRRRFDTANRYGRKPGETETIIGNWFATGGGGRRGADLHRHQGLRRDGSGTRQLALWPGCLPGPRSAHRSSVRELLTSWTAPWLPWELSVSPERYAASMRSSPVTRSHPRITPGSRWAHLLLWVVNGHARPFSTDRRNAYSNISYHRAQRRSPTCSTKLQQ
jgi:hypothetical protein